MVVNQTAAASSTNCSVDGNAALQCVVDEHIIHTCDLEYATAIVIVLVLAVRSCKAEQS
jgi:hypothetical protein